MTTVIIPLSPHIADTCPGDPRELFAVRLAGDPEVRVDRGAHIAWDLRGEPGRVIEWARLRFEASDAPR